VTTIDDDAQRLRSRIIGAFEEADRDRIMAMTGRGAAIAEVGPHRHELHGAVAFSALLGVHASLIVGVRNRIDAFVAWASDTVSRSRGAQVLDRSDAAQIDWDDDPAPAGEPAVAAPGAARTAPGG
jgi:NADH dehydrogenase